MSPHAFRFLLIAALFAGVFAVSHGLLDVASAIRERNDAPMRADDLTFVTSELAPKIIFSDWYMRD